MRTNRGLAEKDVECHIKVDPKLRKQIETAADDEPVEAVLMLRPDDPAQVAASPERTEEVVQEIMRQVEDKVGIGAHRVNVLRYLGSFTIAAPPAFLRELLTKPEQIASAMANRQEGSAYIEPRDVKPVRSGSNRGWSSPKTSKKSSASSRSAKPSSGKSSQKAAKPRKKTAPGKSKK
jgi:hypothetical protein